MSYKDNPKATPSAMAPQSEPGQEVKVGPPGINSDLKEETIVKLGDYLSRATKQNTYPITEAGTTGDLSAQYQNYRPGTEPHTPYDQNGQDSFQGQSLPDAQSYFDNLSRGSSAEMPTANLGDLSSLVNKSGDSSVRGMKGHELLSQIKGDQLRGGKGSKPRAALNAQRAWPDPNEPVVKITSEVLTTNRWSPGPESPYIGNRNGSKGYTNRAYSIQKGFGEYKPNAEGPSFNELAKVGSSAQLVATGYEPNAADPTNTNTFLAILQGVQQQTVSQYLKDVKNLEAREIYNHLVDDKKKLGKGLSTFDINQQGRQARPAGVFSAGGMTEEEDVYSKSNGQLHSYLEPFGGPLPTATLTNAGIAMIAAGVIGLGIISTISLILKLKVTQTVNIPPAAVQPAGRRFGSLDYGDIDVGLKILTFLGIPHYLRSLDINPPENAGLNLLRTFKIGAAQWAKKIHDSPGYFLSVLRQVIRDFRQINDAWNKVDFSNPIGMAEGIFIILEAFATSAAFRWVLAMMKLGDQLIISGNMADNSASWGMVGLPGLNSREEMDGQMTTLSNLHMKSRDSSTGKKLAWRFGSLPNMYLLPTALRHRAGTGSPGISLAAGLRMNGGTLPYGTGDFDSDNISPAEKWQKFKRTDAGRLPQEAVESLENSLDALYMPFYFHDLRTNEIIAFHAFIENITDSFSPEWNAVHGFGRMDDVQIYKRTKRSIGLSFMVVSTSPSDFDEMWYAINRFVAMTYPQWSRGNQKTVLSGDPSNPVSRKFIEPFSQIPTASPVIRMRLGELFKSNYSIPNLQGKFGYGTDSFDLGTPEEEGQTYDQYRTTLRRNAARAVTERRLEASWSAKLTWSRNNDGAPAVSPGDVAALVGSNALIRSGMGHMVRHDKYFTPSDSVKLISDAEGNIGLQAVALRRGKWTSLGTSGTGPAADTPCKIVGYYLQPRIKVTGGLSEDGETFTRTEYKRKRGRRGSNKAASVMVSYIITPAEGSSSNKYFWMCHEGFVGLDEETWKQNYMVANDTTVPDPFGVQGQNVTQQQMEARSTAINNFFSKENNPIVRSFSQAGGQGLAGVITSLEMDWQSGGNATWETSGNPNRAPKMCKITISFSPIHDIPMGLDSEGGMTAAAYPVGGIITQLFGGPTSDVSTVQEYWNKLVRAKGSEQDALAQEEAEAAADGMNEHTVASVRASWT